jgi:hypothetical protein
VAFRLLFESLIIGISVSTLKLHRSSTSDILRAFTGVTVAAVSEDESLQSGALWSRRIGTLEYVLKGSIGIYRYYASANTAVISNVDH